MFNILNAITVIPKTSLRKDINKKNKELVFVDIMVLGCTMPGMATAYNLKKKFGNTIDILLLNPTYAHDMKYSKANVSFAKKPSIANTDDVEESTDYDDMGKQYVMKYANELAIEIPDIIMGPSSPRNQTLNKIFEDCNGNVFYTHNEFQDYKFLGYLERFELFQLQSSLDIAMNELFIEISTDVITEQERRKYYDNYTMESFINDRLLYSITRQIMKCIVLIACGTSADRVSMLFYLERCRNTGGTNNILSGRNIREKVTQYCMKKIYPKMRDSVQDIIEPTFPVWQIRRYLNRQMIVETSGSKNYVCSLLAVALTPEEIHDIRFDSRLLTHKSDLTSVVSMDSTKTRIFRLKYKVDFWTEKGFTGDIFSVKGPVIWAVEKPLLSSTGSQDRYPTIIGFLTNRSPTDGTSRMSLSDDEDDNEGLECETSKMEVINQMVRLFGIEAGDPISYSERCYKSFYVPQIGSYVGVDTLRNSMKSGTGSLGLVWCAIDAFGDADLSAGLEAGHKAAVKLLTATRPQVIFTLVLGQKFSEHSQC